MSAGTILETEDKLTNPNYAWLERARQTFKLLADNPDPAALHGIIAEGLARLKNLPSDDQLLANYLRLTVAEAHMNLALEQQNHADTMAGMAEGRRLCEQATKVVLKAGCGVASNVLPRAITLLAALYKTFPELRQPDLAKSLQKLSDHLDEAHFEQTLLREQALHLLQSARLLVASFDDLSQDDRQALLIQAAEKMLGAGELYSRAGDTKNIKRV